MTTDSFLGWGTRSHPPRYKCDRIPHIKARSLRLGLCPTLLMSQSDRLS
ncbi:hypothetical protein [Coleofasciculus sp. FACHB-129]|nr:hypothetical protein [Coleofasciculus sp. FACHB-129]MBD1896598.1 hypothetical protein [Coleofasciculus sp. FACHB-129]